jgi:hypothetical protein
MARWSSTESARCRCGPASASETRWQIASTLPVHSVTPNRSRASSVTPLREIRYPAVNVTTGACNLGRNGDVAMSSGNLALVLARQRQQRRQPNWWVRCSVQVRGCQFFRVS